MSDSAINISTYFKSLSPLYTYIQPRFFDIQTFSLRSSHLLANVYILALAYPPCHLQLAFRDTHYPCLKCHTPLLGISPFLFDHCCCGYGIFCRDYHICWIPLLIHAQSAKAPVERNVIVNQSLTDTYDTSAKAPY